MTVTGMAMAAIVAACFVGIRTTTSAQRGLDQSNAAQLIAHRFANDVQSACDPSLSTPTCTRSPNPSSGSVSACGTTALFAMDSVSSATAPAADTTVAYVMQGTTLMRVSCPVNGTTATLSRTLATNVTGAAVAYPTAGACAGAFQLTLTLTGTTLGNATPDYNATFCADPRA